jgi:hypothetical protein
MGEEQKVIDRGTIAEQVLTETPDGIRTMYIGVANDRSLESVPAFIQTKSERVFQNNDSWIVLGRDRPADRLSGKGGEGATGAHSIDIVVGRAAASPLIKKSPKKYYVEPNFTKDAARIHISQKTDIDKNFGLTKYAKGSGNVENASGIGLKADAVRVVARQGVKIVSGVDPVSAQNARIVNASGVDLIAYGQDKYLQPIVKGKNLLEALNVLTDQVDSLAGIVTDLLAAQTELNTAVQGHTHTLVLPPLPFTGAGPGGPVTGVTVPGPFGTALPDPIVATAATSTLTKHAQQSALNMQQLRINLVLFKNKYISNRGSKTFINSKHHQVT